MKRMRKPLSKTLSRRQRIAACMLVAADKFDDAHIAKEIGSTLEALLTAKKDPWFISEAERVRPFLTDLGVRRPKEGTSDP